MKNIQRFLDGTMSPFVTEGFPIIRIILVAIISLCAIGLIVTALLQNNDQSGALNALNGGQDSYYSQNKKSSKESILKKLTIIFASVIAVLIILFFITYAIYPAA